MIWKSPAVNGRVDRDAIYPQVLEDNKLVRQEETKEMHATKIKNFKVETHEPKERELSMSSKLKCLRCWTFASNFMVVLSCVVMLLNRAYYCIERYFNYDYICALFKILKMFF